MKDYIMAFLIAVLTAYLISDVIKGISKLQATNEAMYYRQYEIDHNL